MTSLTRLRSQTTISKKGTRFDAEQVVNESFEKVPYMTTSEDALYRMFKKQGKPLSGGKSGARVWRGTFNGKPSILKIYERRDFNPNIKGNQDPEIEDIFASERSAKEKSVAYRRQIIGKTAGDAKLTYIRSLRDLYINIHLQGTQVDAVNLIPKLYYVGHIKDGKSYRPYMITENISADGFKELKTFKPSIRRSRRLMINILYRLCKAIQAKFTALRDKENHFIGCHRDMHPGNIFYKIKSSRNVQIKLIDFDLSITDNELLTRVNACDRKTMSSSDTTEGKIKQRLGQWNATTSGYVNLFLGPIRILPSLRRFAESDADIYMFSAYLTYFLKYLGNKSTDAGFIISKSINMYMNSKEVKNKDLYNKKVEFLKEMIDILGDWLDVKESKNKKLISRRNTNFIDEPLKF